VSYWRIAQPSERVSGCNHMHFRQGVLAGMGRNDLRTSLVPFHYRYPFVSNHPVFHCSLSLSFVFTGGRRLARVGPGALDVGPRLDLVLFIISATSLRSDLRPATHAPPWAMRYDGDSVGI